MMDEKQIAARVDAAHNAFVAKMSKQPHTDIALEFRAAGEIAVAFHIERGNFVYRTGKTAAEVLDKLDAAIAAIPSEAERLRAEAAKAVGAAIEACRAAGYPDDLVNPLTEISKRISEDAISLKGEAE